MEQKDFFMALEDAFDETNIEDLTLETNFRELDEWSSITALSLIASIAVSYTHLTLPMNSRV